MSHKDLEIYKKVEEKRSEFGEEAIKHRRLHRSLWLMTTAVSLAIAYSSTYEFDLPGWLDSGRLAAVLGILLPAITAYITLRSPERLWLFEVSIRNRLSDLAVKIEFAYRKSEELDQTDLEKEYLEIMRDASAKWLSIKQGD